MFGFAEAAHFAIIERLVLKAVSSQILWYLVGIHFIETFNKLISTDPACWDSGEPATIHWREHALGCRPLIAVGLNFPLHCSWVFCTAFQVRCGNQTVQTILLVSVFTL